MYDSQPATTLQRNLPRRPREGLPQDGPYGDPPQDFPCILPAEDHSPTSVKQAHTCSCLAADTSEARLPTRRDLTMSLRYGEHREQERQEEVRNRNLPIPWDLRIFIG